MQVIIIHSSQVTNQSLTNTTLINMYLSLLLLSMSTICQGMVLPTDPDCACINPFSDTLQPHLGDKNLTCEYNSICYVDCKSDCG